MRVFCCEIMRENILFSTFCFEIRQYNSAMKIEINCVNALSADKFLSNIRANMS